MLHEYNSMPKKMEQIGMFSVKLIIECINVFCGIRIDT